MALSSRLAAALGLALLLQAAPAAAGEAEWRLLTEQANLQLQRGNLRQAETFARDALAEAERSLGRNHRAVDQSLVTLALVLRSAQRYPEAEKELRRALAMREKALGPHDPATALVMNNLADVLQLQKKFAEAERWYRRTVPVFEKAHGEDRRTAVSLGAVVYAQGRAAEAEPLLRRSLAMKEKVLGTDSPSVALTLRQLADTLVALGRDAEAKKLEARAAAIQARKPMPAT
jgi:tetratricopeptide (TPR) repeat protein